MKKRLVILTGAGMSAESGISTFRDSGGLWEKHRIEDVASPEGFRANPQLVLDFYNQRRRQLLSAKPNRGHIGLVELENDFEVKIITQNVDNLHEQAGSNSVLHLHGELMKVRSTGDASFIVELTPENINISVGDLCPKGFQLRPHIVWFGESVLLISTAINLAESADIFVVIGTSLNVYPAAGLLDYVARDTPIFLIDPKPVSTQRRDVNIISEVASEGILKLKTILLAK